jgi:hypothetical protein
VARLLEFEMRTIICPIPIDAMRYETLGDYWTDGDDTHIRTVQLADWRHEFLIALHELIEEALTRHRGIAEPDIMAYDLASQSDDPGMEPDAPYHKEHVFADAIERIVACELEVDWLEYEKACEAALSPRSPSPDSPGAPPSAPPEF